MRRTQWIKHVNAANAISNQQYIQAKCFTNHEDADKNEVRVKNIISSRSSQASSRKSVSVNVTPKVIVKTAMKKKVVEVLEYETDSWFAALSNKTLEPILRTATSWGDALGVRKDTYKPKGNVVFGFVEKDNKKT